MDNYSVYATKKVLINGQFVLVPDIGVSLKLRPIYGGDDIPLVDTAGTGIYKGQIPTGTFKIIKDGEDMTNTYGYVNIFDGTISADLITSGVLTLARIPDIPLAKVTGLIDTLNGKLSKAGDTMNGDLNMSAHKISMLQVPSDINDAATKGYVDGVFVKKIGDTMQGNLSMNGYKISSVADPTLSGDAATKNYVDSKDNESLKLNSNSNDIIQGFGTIDVIKQVTFGKSNFPLPESWGTPTADKHLIHKKYLETYVQNYINGQITAYQQSISIIRILANGVVEPNRVYTTLQDGIIAAAANATETNQIVCVIEDDKGQAIQAEDLKDWVHIAGNCETNKLGIKQGEYIVGASLSDLGRIIFSGINFIPKTNGEVVTFRRVVFENCSFVGNFNFTFENCDFRGVNKFKFPYAPMNFTLNSCTGYPILTNYSPTNFTGDNIPIWLNNKLQNTKIDGSLVYDNNGNNALFNEDGTLRVMEVNSGDAESNSLGFDTVAGRLYFKDRSGNIHYFTFE